MGVGASSPLQPKGPRSHIQFSMKNFLWNHTVHIWESYVAFDRQLGLLPLASDTSSRKYSTGNNSGTEWTHQCPFNKIFKKDIQNQALGVFILDQHFYFLNDSKPTPHFSSHWRCLFWEIKTQEAYSHNRNDLLTEDIHCVIIYNSIFPTKKWGLFHKVTNRVKLFCLVKMK